MQSPKSLTLRTARPRFQAGFLTVVACFAIATAFSACGIGLDDSMGPNPDRIMKNEKNQREYDSIKGVYVGSVASSETGLDPFPAKLLLYTVREQDPVDNSDLKPAPRIVLKARLQRLDFVGESDNLVLTGSFDVNTGVIDLQPEKTQSSPQTGTPVARCDAGARQPITVYGTVQGESVVATVFRDGRSWGKLQAKLDTREVKEAADTDEQQDFERLRATYRKVQGAYAGQLVRANADRYTEDITFNLQIVEVREGSSTSGEPCLRPRLSARLLRSKTGEFDDVFFTDVRYFPDKNTLSAKFTGDNRFGSLEIHLRMNEVIEGRSYTATGLWADIKLAKTDSVPRTPPNGDEDLERERRLKTYQEIVGTFEGKITPQNGTPAWGVVLEIGTVEEQVGNKPNGEPRFLPALRARYYRMDTTMGAGDRYLAVRYFTESGIKKVAMTSIAPVNSPVPGAGALSISGVFDGKVISGTLADHRGPQGPLRVQRAPR